VSPWMLASRWASGAPWDELLVRTPVAMAAVKSTRPAMLSHATCRRHVGACRRIDRTTNGAAMPTAMSPTPAGQANMPGRRLKAYKARNMPAMTRQLWIAVSSRKSIPSTKPRKAENARYATAKSSSGTATAARSGSGGRVGGASKTPAAPTPRTTRNQAAIMTARMATDRDREDSTCHVGHHERMSSSRTSSPCDAGTWRPDSAWRGSAVTPEPGADRCRTRPLGP